MNYKVGDKVIVVNTDEHEEYYKVGEVFTILKKYGDDHFDGQSDCPSVGDGRWFVLFEEVAPYSLLLEELLSE